MPHPIDNGGSHGTDNEKCNGKAKAPLKGYIGIYNPIIES